MIGSRNLVSAAVNQPRPGILYAQVSTAKPAPSSFTDPLYVVFPQWHTDYYWRITDWPACHGTTLPAQGAEAVIVQDTAGVYRCVWWDGITVNPASLPPSGAAGGDLAGSYPNPTVKALTGSAWTAPTLLNSWANLGGFETASYLKDPLGFVHLKGAIQGGGTSTVAFVLPAGFRPGATTLHSSAGTGPSAVQLQISSGGNVVPVLTNALSAVGLSGITFLAEN